jgi:hypothetical protein
MLHGEASGPCGVACLGATIRRPLSRKNLLKALRRERVSARAGTGSPRVQAREALVTGLAGAFGLIRRPQQRKDHGAGGFLRRQRTTRKVHTAPRADSGPLAARISAGGARMPGSAKTAWLGEDCRGWQSATAAASAALCLQPLECLRACACIRARASAVTGSPRA